MKCLVIGGAGFIGSYIVDSLIHNPSVHEVCVYDNFSSGKRWHLAHHQNNKKLNIFCNDLYDNEIFNVAKDAQVAILLAANPDIAKAVTEPSIDFHQGTALTQITLEALRMAGCHRLLYASGSGVYGDTGTNWVDEKYSPMEPISTYGASKLACEALISSYCHMFGLKASVFRFGNVVGGRQTHGVAYDFIRKLQRDPTMLDILGDGHQSKPYIHIDDVLKAIHLAWEKQEKIFDVYNVAPNDFTTVNEIAHIVLEEMQISAENFKFHYSGGARGWKGDVPIVRLVTDKIRSLGWKNNYSSTHAVRAAVQSMISNFARLSSYA